MRVLSMSLFKKIVVKHDVGMGEAYMDGDYLVDDLGVSGLASDSWLHVRSDLGRA
jgi:hypothetical protein